MATAKERTPIKESVVRVKGFGTVQFLPEKKAIYCLSAQISIACQDETSSTKRDRETGIGKQVVVTPTKKGATLKLRICNNPQKVFLGDSGAELHRKLSAEKWILTAHFSIEETKQGYTAYRIK